MSFDVACYSGVYWSSFWERLAERYSCAFQGVYMPLLEQSSRSLYFSSFIKFPFWISYCSESFWSPFSSVSGILRSKGSSWIFPAFWSRAATRLVNKGKLFFSFINLRILASVFYWLGSNDPSVNVTNTRPFFLPSCSYRNLGNR